MARAVLVALLIFAGCGGDDPRPTVPERPGIGAPDAGMAAGHGAEPRRVTVPEIDRTAPEAVLRLGAAKAVSGGRAPAGVRLAAPVLAPTAIGRDKQGMARIRVSLTARIRCGGDVVPLIRYFPPPAIARTRIAPGTAAPTELTRRVRFDLARSCRGVELQAVEGTLWADATSAWETEASSAALRFSYRASSPPGGARR
jgi:hypothetical protein